MDCTSLKCASIPNSVTTLGSAVFYGCISLTELHVWWEKPLNVSSSTFYNVPLYNARLYVPKGSYGRYVVADEWKKFSQIIEIEESGIKYVTEGQYNNDVLYDLNGRRAKGHANGIVIKNGKKVIIK